MNPAPRPSRLISGSGALDRPRALGRPPAPARPRTLAFVATLALVASGCGSGSTSGNPAESIASSPAASGAGSEGAPSGSPNASELGEHLVLVTVRDFAIDPESTSAPAGEVTFDVYNPTQEHQHEFVVIRTDLAPDALPTTGDGSVDESGDGIEVVDELEAISGGDSKQLTVDLEPGSYVLICNLVKDGTSHYQEGMRTAFTVE